MMLHVLDPQRLNEFLTFHLQKTVPAESSWLVLEPTVAIFWGETLESPRYARSAVWFQVLTLWVDMVEVTQRRSW